MDVIIYHNPDCGTSRNTLGLIRNAGVEPHVIEYLKTPPSQTMLELLIAAWAFLSVRCCVKGYALCRAWLDDPARSDAQLLDAMMAHPVSSIVRS
ncbi:MAG: hypothetical protein R3E51_00580 [Rhizobiaceae bacterium]